MYSPNISNGKTIHELTNISNGITIHVLTKCK